MARKVVDMSLISQLNAQSQGQEIKKGNSRTTDPNFPLFKTPINEDILVYIPKTNVVVTENGEDMQLLTSHLHSYKNGNIYGQLRCINGLSGGVFEQLGYDGTCPACDSMSDAWALYNRKLDAEAKKLGIQPQNDPTDVLKSARQRILGEMEMKNSEEYVTFPIVIIPTKGKMQPTDDALDNLRVEYVTWRKKRYEDNILASLDTLMVNPGHPAGMYWVWKFSYNVEPSKANARDSAKNAKYVPIVDSGALAFLEKYTTACETIAKPFTNDKATEVIVANQFMFKDDLDKEIDKIMAKTRSLLELSEAGEVMSQAQVGVNPLANFGGHIEAPQNLGVTPNETPTAAPTESPIQFGQ